MSSNLESERSGDEIDFGRIAKRLGEPRHELLKSFLETDISVVNTAELREQTSVARGSVIHHLERLVTWGLVEEQDKREYHGRGGRDARTWTLTDRGHEFCEEHVETPVTAFVSREDVLALEQRIETLESDVAHMRTLMMRIAVQTGTLTEAQAKTAMGEERFQDVFGTES